MLNSIKIYSPNLFNFIDFVASLHYDMRLHSGVKASLLKDVILLLGNPFKIESITIIGAACLRI